MAKENVQIAIRIPAQWVYRLQRLAEALSIPGIPVTQADAVRAAMARGLDELEAERDLKNKRTPPTPATQHAFQHGIRDEYPVKRGKKQS